LGLPFTYELGGEAFLAHGSELGYTLGLLAAGSRPVPPIKGVLVDKLCLNGEANRAFFLQAGYAPEKLVVTGSPKDDLFFEFKQNFQAHEAAVIRQAFDIPPHAPLISLFSGATYPQEEAVQKERISQVVAALLALREDVHLIFKTHPRELPIDYPALIAGHPRVRLAYYKDHPGEAFNNRLICASQLCVMGGSSVAFNVVALEVPLITFDFRNSIAEAAFGQMGVGYYAPDLTALAERAGRLLADDSERAALIAEQSAAVRPLMILDGQNCARIGEAIRA
jgi:UDP-N-acetylglucosamine 2-epimerase